MKLLGFNISKKAIELKAEEPVKKNRKKLSAKLLRQRVAKVDVEMESFNQLIDLAKDIERPDRTLLYNLYEQIIDRDSHLQSQLRTAHFTIQQSDFQILKDNKENAELKKLFETGWFTDFITYAVDQEFWGHSLVEFGQIIDNVFKDVVLIDRYHVIPEFQSVKIETTDSLEDAVSYEKNISNWFLIEIGNKRDLGLLLTAAIEIIYKKYSRTDWSQFNEKFGMPLLSVATDTTNDDELDEIENMASNFGSNGYIISSKDTEFNIETASGTEDGHKKYKDMAEMADNYISKLINGQSATSDEKSYVGSAEVQERILNTYTKGRLSRIQRVVNDNLIPFLTEKGYPLDGCKIQYIDLLKKEPIPTNTEVDPEKKNLNVKELSSDLIEFYSTFKQDNNAVENLASSDKIKTIFDQLTERMYKAAKKGNIPVDSKLILEGEDLIKQTAFTFEKALSEGFSLSKFKPDALFTEKLTKSVWVFSGFKTERQLKDISKLLIGADGAVKPFNKFRDGVLKIHENYNVNWLNTEYNQAVSASQQAANWKQYEQAGDKYYLQYRTAGDERVRSSHAALNRITLPMSDNFWNNHFPPNGWGCRCLTKQVLKSQYDETKQNDVKKATDGFFKGPEKIFAYNPGKQAAIFPLKHPYYSKSNAGKFAELTKAREIAKLSLPVLKKKLIGKLVKLDKFSVKFSATGIKEAFNQPHKFPIEKAHAVNNIEELIKKGELLLKPSADIKGRFKNYWYIKTEINNEASYIVLREKYNGEVDFYTIVDFLKSKND